MDHIAHMPRAAEVGWGVVGLEGKPGGHHVSHEQFGLRLNIADQRLQKQVPLRPFDAYSSLKLSAMDNFAVSFAVTHWTVCSGMGCQPKSEFKITGLKGKEYWDGNIFCQTAGCSCGQYVMAGSISFFCWVPAQSKQICCQPVQLQ